MKYYARMRLREACIRLGKKRWTWKWFDDNTIFIRKNMSTIHEFKFRGRYWISVECKSEIGDMQTILDLIHSKEYNRLPWYKK